VSAPEVKLARIGEAEIAYIDVPPAQSAGGDPATVLLIHGFASTHVVNWVGPSWTGTLTRAGYRVVAFDNRGHGGSTKFHDPAAYDTRLMAADAVGLLDHLGIGRAHVMGYSMGARISAYVALGHPDRVHALLLGGLGFHLVEGVGLPLGIADAMEARSVDQISDPTQRMFRLFAEQNRSDLVALAACIRGSRQVLSPEEVARITAPTLVSVGTRDEIAGPADALAALFPNARALDIPGRDHNLAVGDRVHKEGVVAFLSGLTS
jgi:pimeloyl-ACP methyl ester carboxylesterase